ncbi:MAG: DUF481 domain-containing protein [Myxococcota bacterium]|nr:DUF481 domain-containing protein [Myxococcota bacterium]
MTHDRLAWIALAIVMAASSAALAQPVPTFKYATAEEAAALEKEKEVKWEATAQAGLIMSTGNSRVTTFAAGLSASRKAQQNKLSLDAAAAYARSSIFLADDRNGNGVLSEDELDRPSITSTRSWMVKGRYDRFLTAKNALFVAAGVAADRPAGKELVGNGQAGYSRELYHHDEHTFLGELGYDFTYEDLVVGDGVAIHSIRAFAGYKGALSPDSAVEASVEGLFNMNTLDSAGGQIDTFGDNRITSKLSLTTKLSQKLSFRFAFEARFDSAPAPRPPFAIPYEMGFVPLADELDTKAEATLIVTLL